MSAVLWNVNLLRRHEYTATPNIAELIFDMQDDSQTNAVYKDLTVTALIK